MKYRVTWIGRYGQTVEKIVPKSKLASLIEEATMWGNSVTVEQVWG